VTNGESLNIYVFSGQPYPDDTFRSVRSVLAKVQLMLIENGKKLRFGPYRSRSAMGLGFIATLLIFGAISGFREHHDFLGWVSLVIAVECILLVHSILRRYLKFSEIGVLSHGYLGGIVPVTRFIRFEDIKGIALGLGAKEIGLSGVAIFRIELKNGTRRPVMSVSGLKISGPVDEAPDRFYCLIREFRDAVGAASM
jgi:hypothetical protein